MSIHATRSALELRLGDHVRAWSWSARAPETSTLHHRFASRFGERSRHQPRGAARRRARRRLPLDGARHILTEAGHTPRSIATTARTRLRMVDGIPAESTRSALQRRSLWPRRAPPTPRNPRHHGVRRPGFGGRSDGDPGRYSFPGALPMAGRRAHALRRSRPRARLHEEEPHAPPARDPRRAARARGRRRPRPRRRGRPADDRAGGRRGAQLRDHQRRLEQLRRLRLPRLHSGRHLPAGDAEPPDDRRDRRGRRRPPARHLRHAPRRPRDDDDLVELSVVRRAGRRRRGEPVGRAAPADRQPERDRDGGLPAAADRRRRRDQIGRDRGRAADRRLGLVLDADDAGRRRQTRARADSTDSSSTSRSPTASPPSPPATSTSTTSR